MNEERFADFLDAMVRGTASKNAAPPADIAQRIQQVSTARLDGERRSAIWNALIKDHPGTTPTDGGPGPLPQPALTAPDAFNPWVRRHLPSPPLRRPRMGIVHEAMQTGITAMAIVAVVIAAFITFPILRGDDATPHVTPTAWAAAPTVPGGGFGASSSADTPVATYHHPQSNECRVEPLSIGNVTAIVEGESSGRLAVTSTGTSGHPITEEEYQQLTNSHRSWVACHFNGTGLQLLALESDDMIRSDLVRMNLPGYSPSLVAEQIASLEPDTPSEADTSGFTWDPPSDTYVPMVADWSSENAPTVNEEGEVTVTIVWMNRDGESLSGDADSPIAADLPTHWTYIWSESSGQWLLDSYGP